ncbi:hypothetical protein [Paraglaciecola hydrolytica]|uniref:Uncharacterized protein n=1 Tax=Paraglaciecola hydrolytica TaxID=1799789 RepID=A0A148KMF4_9ALTE|nr:hypothetical protein [Paraglaciecola hydrolytica]KXI27477.1 hypothetical protein AX660_22470 [Paraglaciecola hydrolytica]
MLANWLVAKALRDVTEQEEIICRYKIQAKVHRLRLHYRTKSLLRRPDALALVFLSGCLHGYVGKRHSIKLAPLITMAMNLWRIKSISDEG